MSKQQSLSPSMARIGRLIHSTLNFDEIMKRVIAEAARAVGSETAALLLREGDQWAVRYVHGFPKEVIGARMDDTQEPHAVLALQTKKPVVIDDAFTDERVNREHMKQWGVRSVLVVPLVTGDQAVGALFFNQHQAGAPFQKSHVEFAGQLASSLSLAVRNARLFDSLRAELAEREKAEQTLQEANEQLQVQAEELRAVNEELQAQQEELQAQTEELRQSEQALRESEERHRSLFENMLDGYAYCEMLFDDRGRPADFVYLQVNEAFGRLTGLQNVVGRKASDLFPEIAAQHPEVLEIYGRVATTGRPERFVLEFKPLGLWFSISVHSPRRGCFTAVFDNITERKQAEETVKGSEERLRFVLETCHIGAWDMDIADHTTIRSAEHDRIYGYDTPLPQWTYEMWLAHVVPEDRARVDTVYQNAVKTRSPWSFEYRIRRPDGQVRWIWATGDHRCDADGGVRRVAGIVQDVTERKQAEEALHRAHEELQTRSEELTVANEELQVQSVQLRESEQRLRLALEGGRMGRWEWDLVTDSMFWCERTFALLGLDPFMKASVALLLDCIHPADRESVKKLIARVMNEAKDFQVEFRVLHHREAPRGNIVWLALHAQVIRAAQERAVRTIGVLYDITPRKQMEAELRRLNEKLEEEVQVQTEELRDSIDRLQDEVVRRVLTEGKLRKSSRLLEAFFQHTIAPLAFLDRSFSFVRVNEAFAAAAGKPAPYFVHKNRFALYPSEEDGVIFEQVVQSQQPYQAFARPFPYFDKPQQPTRYWNWRITPLLDDQGQVQFLVFNLEDVTEQQHAFGELEHRADLLQRLTLELSQAEDRERRRLAEILHDDLQQVLAAAKFHLGLLKSRLTGDEETKELADQLTRMLKESIEKSRSLSHELSPAMLYQGDLGETFEWLARQIQAQHGLTVHTEVHGKVETSSEPIRAFLFRAAQEILFNTVKHAQVQEARLRLQRRRGQLWLTIADRGRGFDPQALGRTTGFGLFSIRERVELLGGRMRIHSAKDRGSVVVIAIADEAEEEGKVRTEEGRRALSRSELPTFSPSERPSARSPTAGPLRILLVDDHKVMRAGLAALVAEQADMEVVGQAGDGRKAVELARELSPDVVIMDVAMPMMPGDEAARQIKATLPQARIIALSMFEEPGVAQRMRDAGAEVYLPKTGPSEGLLAAIRGKFGVPPSGG